LLTRHDYIEIARLVHDNYSDEDDIQIISPALIGDLAIMMARDNPRFDVDRFASACIYGQYKDLEGAKWTSKWTSK
jgi:hypothetical protein